MAIHRSERCWKLGNRSIALKQCSTWQQQISVKTTIDFSVCVQPAKKSGISSGSRNNSVSDSDTRRLVLDALEFQKLYDLSPSFLSFRQQFSISLRQQFLFFQSSITMPETDNYTKIATIPHSGYSGYPHPSRRRQI